MVDLGKVDGGTKSEGVLNPRNTGLTTLTRFVALTMHAHSVIVALTVIQLLMGYSY